MQVNRCVNCMEEMNGMVCPHCGFDMTKMVPESYCLRPNTILKGRYLIGRSIGRGGFGITYIGFDLVLDVKVAVKEYFPSGQASRNCSMSNSLLWTTEYRSQELRQSGCDDFLREARKMAKISAIPSIVRVMDTFTENSTAYIVMEYVEGANLKQYLEWSGLLSFQDCVKLLKPLITGLEKAHQQGLIHRDISPDNIMVEKDGSVCLLDLGAAKDLSVSNKAASRLVTKNGFSPLEQYSEAGGIGPWTDVYAMCATIYYCLTGKKPQDALERIEKDELNLDIVQPPLTSDQKKALSAGLVLRRQDRIQDMGQLLTALESEKTDVPVWVNMFCGNCGAKLNEGDSFCGQCGMAVENTISQKTKPDKETYRLTIVRPSSFLCCALAFHIRVDGESTRYDLKNGQTIYVTLKPGLHKIEVGMFGTVQRSVGTLDIKRDRTITCRVSPAGAYSCGIASGPVFLEDENGNRIS